MKQKLLLSLLFLCALLSTSYAQIKKGSTWLGSNISYSRTKDKPEQQQFESEIRTTNVTPAVGVAVKDNLVVGVFGTYTEIHKEHEGTIIDRREKSYGGGLFVRRYVPVFNRFYIYGEGRVGYNAFKTNEEWEYANIHGSYKTKGWETGISFTPGISYGVTQYVQLEAGFASLFDITYNKRKNYSDNSNNKSTTKTFTTGVNLENVSQLFIGVRFLINKG